MGAPESIWGDTVALASFYQSQAVPLNPNAGILIASILVSILGSYATLLLLGRRTSSRGLRNTLLLILAGICFAAVAVWGMHFVSMISVRLKATPDLTWYLQFSAGFTVMSLFVPLLAVTFAFWFLGSELEFQYWRVIVSGIIVGLTIGLMHYSASFRLPFLDVSYTAVTVVFALVLACVAATAALFLFFRLRAQWQDSFWKRCICALFLATAVCGMHYLGLGGTSYRVKAGVTSAQLSGGRSQSIRLTIAIAVMCAFIIALSIAIAIVDFLVRRDVRKIARQIVVASATFDRQGRLLVRPDGTLPMQLIETDADLKDVLEELDPRRSTFQWLYTLSFNWGILRPFMTRITASNARRRTKSRPSRSREMGSTSSELSLFRNRFVEAVIELARELELPVERIGTMFDRVLTTGTKKGEAGEKESHQGDSESSHDMTVTLATSEGVMLFLVRELGSLGHKVVDPTDSVEYYAAKGYRLAETRFFAPILAERVGVSKAEMDVFLSACKTYAKRGTRAVVQSGGTYLGLFGVRPSPSADKGLDVLVYNFARHQIPAYRLPDVDCPLSPAMRAWVEELSNCTMHQALIRCNDAVQARDDEAERKERRSITSNEVLEDELYEFQYALANAIEAVAIALRSWPRIYHIARLSSEVLDVPASTDDSAPPAQMIVLEVVLPNPEARLTPIHSRASGVQAPELSSARGETDQPPAPFVYTPFSLFAKTQMMLLRGHAHADFARSVTQELLELYPGRTQDAEAEVKPATVGIQTSQAGALSDPLFMQTGRRFSKTSDDLDVEKGMRQISGQVFTISRDQPMERSTGSLGQTAGVYASAREGTDGWYVRRMQSLENSSQARDLQGTQWR